MKLELKHLQGYPMHEDSGILIQTKTRTISSQGKPMGYKTGRLIGLSARTEVEILFDKNEFSEDYDLTDIKPILHPLSDLTKEIERNGEKFVPLEKMQELYPASMNDIKLIDYEENSGQWMLNTKRDGEVSINIMRQIDQKLYEWHFDLFDLINNDLAINISEL